MKFWNQSLSCESCIYFSDSAFYQNYFIFSDISDKKWSFFFGYIHIFNKIINLLLHSSYNSDFFHVFWILIKYNFKLWLMFRIKNSRKEFNYWQNLILKYYIDLYIITSVNKKKVLWRSSWPGLESLVAESPMVSCIQGLVRQKTLYSFSAHLQCAQLFSSSIDGLLRIGKLQMIHGLKDSDFRSLEFPCSSVCLY